MIKKNLNFFVYGIFLILTFFLIYFALNNKINLFYSPEEISLNTKNLIGKEIKVGGIVKLNSVTRYDNLTINFIITDYRYDIKVIYTGILPDLFRDHQGILVIGKLITDDIILASKILAKHDEKYIPKK